MAQVLRRYERAGELHARRARQALEDFEEWTIERYPAALFLRRIRALRANATAYVASCLAPAEALDAPLLTADRRMATVPGHAARVDVL